LNKLKFNLPPNLLRLFSFSVLSGKVIGRIQNERQLLIQWKDGQQTFQNAYFVFTSKEHSNVKNFYGTTTTTTTSAATTTASQFIGSTMASNNNDEIRKYL
jgi:hypothetical protein